MHLIRAGERGKAAVGTRDHALAPDHIGKACDPLRHATGEILAAVRSSLGENAAADSLKTFVEPRMRELEAALTEASDKPLSVKMRLSLEDWGSARGLDLDDSVQVARWLADDGVDFIHASLWNAAAMTKTRPERMRLFPASGEINRHLATDAKSVLARVQKVYEKSAASVDFTDGLSMEFADWRFNLRGSNTEPLVRLNVESRANEALMQDKTQELLGLMDS